MSDPPPPNPKPRDAATLILVRDLATEPRILMGQRTTRDVWSKLYVFPGGTVDRGDHRIPAAPLRPEVRSKVELAASPSRAAALGVAAVRETFEETGLRLATTGDACFPPSADPTWHAFAHDGSVPDLSSLHYLCRAITPPRRPKRFNARFFLAEADHLDHRTEGSGELHDLQWFTLGEIGELPLPLITQAVLAEARERLESGDLRTPEQTRLYRTIRERHLRLWE